MIETLGFYVFVYPLLWTWMFFIFALVRYCCTERGRMLIFIISLISGGVLYFIAKNTLIDLMILSLFSGGAAFMSFLVPIERSRRSSKSDIK